MVVEELVKTYRVKKRMGLLKSRIENVEALKGVSFKIKYGEVVGLLGPNGAGKTTTIKILATLLLPDSGSAYVAGYDVVREADRVRENIGLMLTVEKGFYGKLTGRENLEYFAALYGLDRNHARERIDYLIKLLELDKLGADYKLFEEYSLGMKARLSLARALLRDSPVLLLDEPTLGLDPPSARKIRELVRSLAHEEKKAVLYTTHNMFEAEIVCDRILLINKGRIVIEGTPDELKTKIPKTRIVILVVKGGKRRVVEEIASGFNIRFDINESNGEVYSVKFYVEKPEEVLNDIVKKYVRNGFDIVSVKIDEPTLEDVFIYFSKSG